MLPLVSVVVLAYNHEDYLAQALDGILAQVTDFPFEIVVGEDCSTDRTRALAEEYVDRHPDVIHLITGPENVGGVANSARCVREARGEYVAFCEGDDWWLDRGKLAKQVALMTSDVGIVHADLTRASYLPGSGWTLDPGSMHGGTNPDKLQGDLFATMLREAPIQTCTSIYRRSIVHDFLETPLAATHHLMGDLPRAVFGAANWKVAYLDEVVAVWRRAPNSATRGDYRKRIEFVRDAISIYGELAEMFGERPDFDHGAVSRAYQWLIDIGFRGNDQSAVLEGLAGLRRSDPPSARSARNLIRRLVVHVPPLHSLMARRLRSRNPSDQAMNAESRQSPASG